MARATCGLLVVLLAGCREYLVDVGWWRVQTRVPRSERALVRMPARRDDGTAVMISPSRAEVIPSRDKDPVGTRRVRPRLRTALLGVGTGLSVAGGILASIGVPAWADGESRLSSCGGPPLPKRNQFFSLGPCDGLSVSVFVGTMLSSVAIVMAVTGAALLVGSTAVTPAERPDPTVQLPTAPPPSPQTPVETEHENDRDVPHGRSPF